MLRGRQKDSDILLNCSCVDIKFAAKAKEIKELNDQKKTVPNTIGTQLIFSGLAFFGKMWRCHDALESVQPELVSM